MNAQTSVVADDAPGGHGAPAAPARRQQAWTCPFCALLCDGFGLEAGADLRLLGSDCPRAQAALAHFGAAPSPAAPSVDGAPATLDAALDAAARLLAASRQPLIGGMATDVAGARALYRLANASGAILDHAHGDTLMHSLRALQDRGLFYTTLAEIRNRADLVVCLGTDPAAHYPEFFRRCAPAADGAPQREVVFVGVPPAGNLVLEGASVEYQPLQGDVFDTAALLAALLARRRPTAPDAALAALAERMHAASYCVIVWEAASLPAHGALVAEAVLRMVNTLNRTTRAAAFCLTGSDGAYTANYAVSWLSGLPLRTGVLGRGLVHDPVRYATAPLLADGAVDALLWVASLAPPLAPPQTTLPLIVLGHPALAAALAARPGVVFIPVSTPGIGAAGHMFRADGGVVLPLEAVYADTLPGVAEVAGSLLARLGAAGKAKADSRTGDGAIGDATTVGGEGAR